GALPDQVAGDPRRKLGGDLKAVLPLQAVARRWAEDGFLDAVAVEVGDLDTGPGELLVIQEPQDVGQPFLPEAKDEAPARAGLAHGEERPQHGREVLDLPTARERARPGLLRLIQDDGEGLTLCLLSPAPGGAGILVVQRASQSAG